MRDGEEALLVRARGAELGVRSTPGQGSTFTLMLPADLAQHGETRALRAVTRPSSASPAAGTAKKHAQEQADLISRAFDR